MTVVFFVVVAIMRVIQQVCNKKASDKVNNWLTFFHYGGYHQLFSALCALILLCIIGFEGFNLPTVLCAIVSAILFAVDLYAGIEAVKGTSLVVCNMFALGGLFVPCVLGIFLFNEPMSVGQWFGLVIFFVSIYFLSAKADEEEKLKKKLFTVRTLIMLVLCFLSNGLIMVVQKYFALLVPNRNEAMYSFLTFIISALILYVSMAVLALTQTKTSGKTLQKIEKLSGSLLICGGALAIALFAVNVIITTLASVVPSAILFTVSSALSIVITCIVGAVGFKEKLTVKNIIGLVLGFISIIIVNVC